MKHINITNWQGNITDWTKFNYVYGGLDETIADKVNLSIPGTNLRNYIKKSDNLIPLPNMPQADFYGLNYKVENGVISVWGTATNSVNLWLNLRTVLPANTRYYINFFHEGDHEGNIVYNIAKEQYDWTNRIYAPRPQFTFNVNYSMGAICLQFDANKQYNCTFKPMVVYGAELPTTYEPYGSMILVENVGRLLGSTYKNDIITATTLGGLTCTVIQTDKDLIRDNFRTITAKNNLNLTNVSASVQWSNTQVNVLACNNSQRILINFDQSLTEEEMIEKAKTLVLDYKLITPKVTVFNQVDLGTLNWIARKIGSSTDYRMMASDLSSVIALSASDAVPANISCPKYKTLPANKTYLKNNGISVDGSGTVAVYDENYNQSTSAPAFKESVKGVILIYETKGSSSAATLSMASPMQLQDNVEDITDNMRIDELLEPANEER